MLIGFTWYVPEDRWQPFTEDLLCARNVLVHDVHSHNSPSQYTHVYFMNIDIKVREINNFSKTSKLVSGRSYIQSLVSCFKFNGPSTKPQ